MSPFARESNVVTWELVGEHDRQKAKFFSVLSHVVSCSLLESVIAAMELTELYRVLVFMISLILPNIRKTGGNTVEESLERYKIEGKVTIQGFKPSGKDSVCNDFTA